MIKILSRLFLLGAGLAILSAGCNAVQPQQTTRTITESSVYTMPLQVGAKTIQVQIATDSKSQAQGLSGRDSLTDEQGMFFDFRSTSQAVPGFWMKGMRFDLDFIWISNNKIIGITPQVPHLNVPDDQLPVYFPPAPVDYTLEVNSGWAQRNGVKVGDTVMLK